MADEPDSIYLIYLRRLDEKMDRLTGEMRDLKVRMTGVEEGMASVSRRIDPFDTSLDRFEHRLRSGRRSVRNVMTKLIVDAVEIASCSSWIRGAQHG